MTTTTNLPDRMDPLDQLRTTAPGRIAAAATISELDVIEAETLGRQSPVAEARRALGSIEDAGRTGRRRQRPIWSDRSSVLATTG